MSCTAAGAAFREPFAAAGRDGVDDLDLVPSVVVSGVVGERDLLKFWAAMSATSVGDCEGEASSSSLRSGSDFILGSIVVVVVTERENEGVAVKHSSLAMGGADRSAALLLLRLALRDEL